MHRTEKSLLSEIYCTGTDFNPCALQASTAKQKEPARGMYFPCSMQATFKLGGYLVGLVLLVLILAGMCFEVTFFSAEIFVRWELCFPCFRCFRFFALHRDRENCIKGCKACTKKCPSNIGLPEDGSPRVEGDCFQCQKCIDTCPKGNIHTSVKGICGNEFWFTILRAVILLILLLWLGV